MRVTRDIDLAEECVQDAYTQALSVWTESGIPDRPGGWLTTVARRRAVDRIRREAVARRALPLLVDDDIAAEPDERDGFPDDRLRLVFTCCHPAIAQQAQVALTLRLLCGLTTGEVARAFLVSEPTMAARITRAKKKIAAARIPYRVPTAADLPERVDVVLAVLHLLFTTGHSAPAGADLIRHDLIDRAVDLARMMRLLLPGDPDVAGLLALLLLTDARRDTRVDDAGRFVLLADQDRARWDRDAIAEGETLLTEAMGSPPAGRYTLQAAIAAVHARGRSWTDTDWAEIVARYDELLARWPSPVVALNRAVAVGFAVGPETGLAELDQLAAEPVLAGYGYLPAARAEFLLRLGRVDDARLAFSEALLLTENDVERAFLAERLAAL